MKKNLSLLSKLSTQAKAKLRKLTMPGWIDPMLATLTKDYFSDPDWLYEHKWDGERILAFKKHNKVTLLTRNNKSANAAYPHIVRALESSKAPDFIIDGEVIAMKHGRSNFELLQGVMHTATSPSQEKVVTDLLHYCIFDIMYVDGYDTRDLELIDRKALLKNLLIYKKPLEYTDHILNNGLPYFKQACKKKWEGLIAKNIHSTYVGMRTKSWLKFKCIMEQELIIIGYTEPQGSRSYFGALLVGYYKGSQLIYAGKVGTGFSQEILQELGSRLEKLQIKKSSVVHYTESLRGVHWVKPVLVGEFKFSEWTTAGKLRHARYQGLRTDKDAKEVVREMPKRISLQ